MNNAPIPSFEFRALIQYPSHKSWVYYNILNPWTGTKSDTAIVRDLLWTGLKDKNSKKIFQADVIKKDNGAWGIVVWKQPFFEITVSPEQSSLYTKEWIEDSIVIGNIYESSIEITSLIGMHTNQFTGR